MGESCIMTGGGGGQMIERPTGGNAHILCFM